MRKPQAILLVGPTGSGKTPLGEFLQSQGLRGRRCAHFDFGENLRRLANGKTPADALTSEELDVIAHSLQTGALLENEDFAIARKMLLAFLAEQNVHGDDLVVLNGLPRHVGQAEDVDSVLDVEAVIYLSCSPRVVLERIGADAGGDRADRTDDDEEAIKSKLEIFTERTAPLLEHYRQKGARIETIEITATITPKDIWEMLNRSQPTTK